MLERYKGALAVTLTAKKMKDSSEPPPLRLDLTQVATGWFDSAGCVETALAVTNATRITVALRKATGTGVVLAGNSHKVLSVLSDLNREHGTFVAQERVPEHVRVTTAAALHKRYREKYGDGVKPDTQRKQVERALDALEASGHIAREGPYVWPVPLARVA